MDFSDNYYGGEREHNERKISNDDQPSCSSRAHSRGSGRPALEQNREILTIRRFPEASEQNVLKVIVID